MFKCYWHILHHSLGIQYNDKAMAYPQLFIPQPRHGELTFHLPLHRHLAAFISLVRTSELQTIWDSGDASTHPSLRDNLYSNPAPTQTLYLTQHRIGTSPETWINPDLQLGPFFPGSINHFVAGDQPFAPCKMSLRLCYCQWLHKVV